MGARRRAEFALAGQKLKEADRIVDAGKERHAGLQQSLPRLFTETRRVEHKDNGLIAAPPYLDHRIDGLRHQWLRRHDVDKGRSVWIVRNGLHRMLEDMRAKRANMRAQIDRIVLMGTQEMRVEPRPRLFSPLRKRQTRHGQTIGSNRASSARGHHHANAARPHPRCAREHARRRESSPPARP